MHEALRHHTLSQLRQLQDIPDVGKVSIIIMLSYFKNCPSQALKFLHVQKRFVGIAEKKLIPHSRLHSLI